jgi:hypothetical protein
MRLYKYLLITDEVINNHDIFINPITDTSNKFYTYAKDEKISFMSFNYPGYGKYKTAYMIINNEDIKKEYKIAFLS